MEVSTSQDTLEQPVEIPEEPDFENGPPPQEKINEFVSALIKKWEKNARSENESLKAESIQQAKRLREFLEKIDQPWRINDLIRKNSLTLTHGVTYSNGQSPFGFLILRLRDLLWEELENCEDIEKLLSIKVPEEVIDRLIDKYEEKVYDLVVQKIEEGDEKIILKLHYWVQRNASKKPIGWDSVHEALNNKSSSVLGF